jgi:predicted PurR-regulated permease PerM
MNKGLEISEGNKTVGFWDKKSTQMVFNIAAMMVVVSGLKAAAEVLIPVAYAFFLAVLSYPLMRGLMNKKVPNVLALLITLGINLMVIAGAVTMGVQLLLGLKKDLPSYVGSLKQYWANVLHWLEEHGASSLKETLETFVNMNNLETLALKIDFSQSFHAVLGGLGSAVTVLVAFVMVLVLMMFVLMEAPGTRKRLVAIREAGGPDITGLSRSASDIQKFLLVKTLISALTGVLAGVLCSLFGLQYPILWAILAFVLNYVPAVGSTAASIPAILEALAQRGPEFALVVAVGYGGINFLLDNFVQPTLLGRKFGISALVIILSVIFWGWVWGPMGMFIAVPLTMVIKVLLDQSDEYRWVAVAMSKKNVSEGDDEV